MLKMPRRGENIYKRKDGRREGRYKLDERIRLERYLLKSNDSAKYGILLVLYSGMRIGEICALKRSNIYLKAGTKSFCQTLQRLHDKENKGQTKILISEPKSQRPLKINLKNT